MTRPCGTASLCTTKIAARFATFMRHAAAGRPRERRTDERRICDIHLHVRLLRMGPRGSKSLAKRHCRTPRSRRRPRIASVGRIRSVCANREIHSFPDSAEAVIGEAVKRRPTTHVPFPSRKHSSCRSRDRLVGVGVEQFVAFSKRHGAPLAAKRLRQVTPDRKNVSAEDGRIRN